MLLTLRMAEALKGGAPRALFVEVEHPSGTGRFWTGIGTKSWNGFTWTGSGRVGGVGPITQVSDIAIQEITFWLSGIDPDIANRLNGDVRNLTGTVWLACLDDREIVIADPFLLMNSVLDYQKFKVEDNGTTTVQVVGRTGFTWLERSVDEAWTPENQKLLYPATPGPADTGLDLIPTLVNKDILITW